MRTLKVADLVDDDGSPVLPADLISAVASISTPPVPQLTEHHLSEQTRHGWPVVHAELAADDEVVGRDRLDPATVERDRVAVFANQAPAPAVP
jgi:hypothetical protein